MEVSFGDGGFVRPYSARGSNVVADGLWTSDTLGVNGPSAQKDLSPPADRGHFSTILDKGPGNVQDLLPKAQFFGAGTARNDQPLVFHGIKFANWGVWVDLVPVKAGARSPLERRKDDLVAGFAKAMHGKEDFHILKPICNKHQTFWLHHKNLIGKQAPIPAPDHQAKPCFFHPKPGKLPCRKVALRSKLQDSGLSLSILPVLGRNFSSGKTVS